MSRSAAAPFGAPVFGYRREPPFFELPRDLLPPDFLLDDLPPERPPLDFEPRELPRDDLAPPDFLPELRDFPALDLPPPPDFFAPDLLPRLDFPPRERLPPPEPRRDELFDPPDFFEPPDFEPELLLPEDFARDLLPDVFPPDLLLPRPELFLTPLDLLPREEDLLLRPEDFELPEPLRGADDDDLPPAPPPLEAAFPAIAPMTPPTTAPTGPATLPITAPVAAPAACFEIGGIEIDSEDDGSVLPEGDEEDPELFSCSAIRIMWGVGNVNCFNYIVSDAASWW